MFFVCTFLFLFNSSTTFTQAHTQVATPDDANKFFPSRITNIHNQSLPQFQTSILIYILIDRGKVYHILKLEI